MQIILAVLKEKGNTGKSYPPVIISKLVPIWKIPYDEQW